jgi:hypothetical protein
MIHAVVSGLPPLGTAAQGSRRASLHRVNWLQFPLVYNTSAKKHGFTTNLLRRNNIVEYDTLKIQRSRSQKKNIPNRAFGKFCLITTYTLFIQAQAPGMGSLELPALGRTGLEGMSSSIKLVTMSSSASLVAGGLASICSVTLAFSLGHVPSVKPIYKSRRETSRRQKRVNNIPQTISS